MDDLQFCILASPFHIRGGEVGGVNARIYDSVRRRRRPWAKKASVGGYLWK